MHLSFLLSALSATALAAPLDISIASDVAVIPRAAEAFTAVAPKSLLERGLSALGFSHASQVKGDLTETRRNDLSSDVQEDLIEKRQNDLPEMFIVTDEEFRRVRVYYRDEIRVALDEGWRRHRDNQLTAPWGNANTQYPHYYSDNDGRIQAIPGRISNGPFLEFPIFRNRNNGSPNLYAGGNPRRDRVVFDQMGNFITIMAHSEGDNSFYPGHAVVYNPTGDHFQLATQNAFPGSNPDYSRHWGVAAVLTIWIQNFRRRVDGGGSW